MFLYLYSSATVSQREKIKSSSYNSHVNNPHIPESEKKREGNIARAQTWKVKADQGADNHLPQKKHRRKLYLKKNKTTRKTFNEKLVGISFPWIKSAFQMCSSSDKKKREIAKKWCPCKTPAELRLQCWLLRWPLKSSRTGGWILPPFSPLPAPFAHVLFYV